MVSVGSDEVVVNVTVELLDRPATSVVVTTTVWLPSASRHSSSPAGSIRGGSQSPPVGPNRSTRIAPGSRPHSRSSSSAYDAKRAEPQT